MSPLTVLAHGGTAGLAIEISLLVLPIVVFAFLAAWSGRRARAAEAAEEAARAAGDTGPSPDGSGPDGSGPEPGTGG